MEQTMEPVAQTTPAQSAVETPTPAGAPGSAPTPPKNRKKRKKTVRRIIAAVLVLAVGFTLFKKFGKKEGEAEIGTAIVDYGSITSMVNGSGMVKAKKSESITLATAGTVGDVFVTEGQKVAAGDPLFTYDSPDAEKKVREAKTNIEGYQKQLNAAYKDIAKLNLTAPYAGKLLETVKLTVGDEVGAQKARGRHADAPHAVLQLRLSERALRRSDRAGLRPHADVLDRRQGGEGTYGQACDERGLGAVQCRDRGPERRRARQGYGGLRETVYPYEAGKLDYYRTSELSIPAGTVVATNLIDYLSVSAGEPLVQVNGENTENTIFNLEQSLQKAQKELEEAEKNAAYANAVAPIDGMVIGLSITPGQEITASATALTISDTNTVTISATVDERNVSYLKVGMGVDLNQWGNPSFGTISSVSLSSSVNNGVATYPFTIEADNADGTLQINSNINYNLTASQSDNCLVLPIQAVRTVGLEDGTSATVVYLKADSMPDNAIELPYSDETIPEGFYPVQVEIGIQDNNNVEIKSGVEQGAEVFTQYMTGSATSWDNYGMVY